MKVIEMLQQQNPLHQQPIQIQRAVTRMSEGLCIKYKIDKLGEEFVMFFGLLADKNNLEAISTWIFSVMSQSEADSMRQLINEVETQFENKLLRLLPDNACFQ